MSSKKFQLLDGTALKIIAMTSMVIDHLGDMFFGGALWMRMIGRIAMPIFAFCIAEGYSHTSDRKRYLMRMGLFALISEIPFDLAFSGKPELGHQNIIFTFFLSIIALLLYDRITGSGKGNGKVKTVLGVLDVLAVTALSLILRADYTLFAVISVFLFYVFRKKDHLVRAAIGVAFLALTRTVGYYCATGLSFIPLAMYNGKKGRGLKWLFYVFYPGHLLLLWLIKLIIYS